MRFQISQQPDIIEKLNGLWREVDALGGSALTAEDNAYCYGVERALRILEESGFSEGRSDASDEINSLREQLQRATAALAAIEKSCKPEVH